MNAAGKLKRVIIVATDCTVTDTMRKLLLNDGYTLVVVDTAERCREAMAVRPGDLIIAHREHQAGVIDLITDVPIYGLNDEELDSAGFMHTVHSYIGKGYQPPWERDGLTYEAWTAARQALAARSEEEQAAPCGHGESFVTGPQDAVLEEAVV